MTLTGGRILLKNTTLHLFRGRRYGLCGANGAGKSTLMRSIAAGQLDVRACPGVSGAGAQWCRAILYLACCQYSCLHARLSRSWSADVQR